ncbi:multiprotein-bridging factor 1 family protein [Nonomuraea sp. NPDC049655]|uniref:multiprotein-bridging factor 1 family protein n=1 Tax=Nonomuraea sp. NPDC049655 TaxID=3364355 RepID=UPI0037A082EC
MLEQPRTPRWAERIRDERRQRGWSQKQLARHLFQAAGEEIALPEFESVVRRIKDHEAGNSRPKDPYPLLYCRVFGMDEAVLFDHDGELVGTLPTSGDLIEHTAWIEQTNVGNSTIAMIDETHYHLTQRHTQTAPAPLLADVLRLHRRVLALLRGGKQRLHQTRELFRIDAELLAHACILLGDLYDDESAIVHGRAALLSAQEAGASEAAALSAQAKTERWRCRYAVSADAARRGYECSPPTPLRVLLASQEANAASLLGDFDRAREALHRADEAAGSVASDSGVTPWSCPAPRRALYALSVALQASDHAAALQAAAAADDAWANGAPWVAGTWAQVRFGAGIAYVMMEDLDAAAEQVTPALSLPPEHRLSTITNYLVRMDARLAAPRFRGSDMVTTLREQIKTFNSARALPAPVEEDA